MMGTRDALKGKRPRWSELIDFLELVKEFLHESLHDERYVEFLWTGRPEIEEAARETFEKDIKPSIDELRLFVIEKSNKQFYRRKLERHGLTRNALKFKLMVVTYVATLKEAYSAKGYMREWFYRMCEAIDAVLDSLIDAAVGIGGAIKEFKDMLLVLAHTELPSTSKAR